MYSDVEGDKPFPGLRNINLDPEFTSGLHGDYYLSQIDAGQPVKSPCIDAGDDSAEKRGLDLMTTRTDGVQDSSTVDMGYHYISPFDIKFTFNLDSDKVIFKSGDNLKLNLKLKTTEASPSSDIYMIMANPNPSYYSALDWLTGIRPFLTNFTFPEKLSLDNIILLDVTIPCSLPPIEKAGKYIFAIAAFKTQTAELSSNISTVNFTVE